MNQQPRSEQELLAALAESEHPEPRTETVLLPILPVLERDLLDKAYLNGQGKPLRDYVGESRPSLIVEWFIRKYTGQAFAEYAAAWEAQAGAGIAEAMADAWDEAHRSFWGEIPCDMCATHPNPYRTEKVCQFDEENAS